MTTLVVNGECCAGKTTVQMDRPNSRIIVIQFPKRGRQDLATYSESDHSNASNEKLVLLGEPYASRGSEDAVLCRARRLLQNHGQQWKAPISRHIPSLPVECDHHALEDTGPILPDLQNTHSGPNPASATDDRQQFIRRIWGPTLQFLSPMREVEDSSQIILA